MTAIAFLRFPDASGWTVAEREVLLTICDVAPDDWNWEAGVTESGDPQLYLLGPHPEQICELCISRTGGRYVLEDGAGRLLAEHRTLDIVTMHAKTALRGPHSRLVARTVLLWCTVRQVIHERVEPVLAESEELLVHVAPQLAMFA